MTIDHSIYYVDCNFSNGKKVKRISSHSLHPVTIWNKQITQYCAIIQCTFCDSHWSNYVKIVLSHWNFVNEKKYWFVIFGCWRKWNMRTSFVAVPMNYNCRIFISRICFLLNCYTHETIETLKSNAISPIATVKSFESFLVNTRKKKRINRQIVFMSLNGDSR